MSMISDKVFHHGTGSIVGAPLTVNFLSCCGLRTKLLWIDVMLLVPAANYS